METEYIRTFTGDQPSYSIKMSITLNIDIEQFNSFNHPISIYCFLDALTASSGHHRCTIKRNTETVTRRLVYSQDSLAQGHAEIVRPEAECQESFAEGEVEIADSEQPPEKPQPSRHTVLFDLDLFHISTLPLLAPFGKGSASNQLPN